MTDITAPEYTLVLIEWSHWPSIPFTNRRLLRHTEHLGLNGIREPSDNRRVERVVKRELINAFRSFGENGFPISHAQ